MAGKSVYIQLCFSMFVFILPEGNSVPDLWMTKLRQFQDYQTQIESISVLEYGDSCHSEDVEITETTKQVLEQLEIINTNKSPILGSELDNLNAALKQFLTTGHKLCNGYKMFACDESSKLCTCGPTRISNREFSYIRDPKGNCLWAKDTPCFPIDNKQSKIRNYCANDTKCVFNNSRAIVDCNFSNIHIRTIIKYYGGTVVRPQCYCKADFEELSQHGNKKSLPFHLQSSTPANSNPTDSCNCSSRNIIQFVLMLFPSLFILYEIF